MAGYREMFDASIADPAAFWADAAKAVTWTREPTQILDDSNPPFYRWFPDGELNTCENALDRHVAAGHGDRTALVYDSPVTGESQINAVRSPWPAATCRSSALWQVFSSPSGYQR